MLTLYKLSFSCIFELTSSSQFPSIFNLSSPPYPRLPPHLQSSLLSSFCSSLYLYFFTSGPLKLKGYVALHRLYELLTSVVAGGRKGYKGKGSKINNTDTDTDINGHTDGGHLHVMEYDAFNDTTGGHK